MEHVFKNGWGYPLTSAAAPDVPAVSAPLAAMQPAPEVPAVKLVEEKPAPVGEAPAVAKQSLLEKLRAQLVELEHEIS